jgi:APA family basic amino acid/polyamine antiporter
MACCRASSGSSTPVATLLTSRFLCYSTIAIVLALTGSFAELVVLSTLAAAVYIAGCAASWVLARRGVALSGTPLNFRFLGFAAVIGISSMLALIALGSRQEIIGLATLIGLSILLYLIQARIALAQSH